MDIVCLYLDVREKKIETCAWFRSYVQTGVAKLRRWMLRRWIVVQSVSHQSWAWEARKQCHVREKCMLSVEWVYEDELTDNTQM